MVLYKMRVVVDTNVFINGLFKNDDFCKAIFRLKSLNKIIRLNLNNYKRILIKEVDYYSLPVIYILYLF